MTNKTNETPLLPCPFCGHQPIMNQHRRDGLEISCQCGIKIQQAVIHKSLDWLNEHMTDKWNTRAPVIAETPNNRPNSKEDDGSDINVGSKMEVTDKQGESVPAKFIGLVDRLLQKGNPFLSNSNEKIGCAESIIEAYLAKCGELEKVEKSNRILEHTNDATQAMLIWFEDEKKLYDENQRLQNDLEKSEARYMACLDVISMRDLGSASAEIQRLQTIIEGQRVALQTIEKWSSESYAEKDLDYCCIPMGALNIFRIISIKAKEALALTTKGEVKS